MGRRRRGLPEIQVGTLRLRPWRVDDDAVELAAAFADPEMRRWLPFGATPAQELEQARVWLAQRAASGRGEDPSFAVRDADDGALLGGVSLHFVDSLMGNAMLGYWTVAGARRRGVATAAARAAARWSFQELGLHRLHLSHDPENGASCRVALRAGFAAEGVRRQAFRRLDGAYRDEHTHARLATDPDPEPDPGAAPRTVGGGA